MLGLMSQFELLKVGPRLVGVPKVKSALATSVVRPNAKTNTSEIVFFILLLFQKVLIISLHTVRTFSGLGLSLRKSRLTNAILDSLLLSVFDMQVL